MRKRVCDTRLLQCGHWVSLFPRGAHIVYLLQLLAESSLGRVSSSTGF